MNKLQELSETFQLQYDSFVNGCAALEEEGLWTDDQYESMEVYYFNDIMCVILCLASSDGTFSDAEAGYINDIFGFSYTSDELQEIYGTEGSNIRSLLINDVPAGYRRMKELNEKLAAHYRDILLLICDIIAESDGIVHIAEANEIRKLKEALKD